MSRRAPSLAWRPRDAALALGVGALALAWFSLTWSHTLDPRDEGYLIGRSLQTAGGLVPHRDFVDVYGPLVFTVTGQALLATDGEILGVRWLLGALKALAVVATFLLGRSFAPAPFAVAASLAAIAFWGRADASLNTPYAALFSLPLCLWSTLGVVVGLERRAPWPLLAAGVAAGLAVLAKQSVGILHVYALLLAIWGAGLLAPTAGVPLSRRPRAAVAGFAVAGLVVVIPLAPFLDIASYAIHLAPLHVALLGVCAALLHRTGAVGSFGSIVRTALPFAVGVGAVLLATVALYASWGALDRLLWDMFVIPRQYRSYALPVVLPTPGLALAVAGALAALHAGVAAARGEGRRAAAVATAAAVALALGIAWTPGLRDTAALDRLPFAFEGLLAPGIALASAALLLLPALRGGDVQRAARLLPLLFAHVLLCVQVFPRAGHNLWALHGALMPLLAPVLFAWSAPDRAPTSARRGLAIALVWLVPIWLVAPVVTTVARQQASDTPRRALELPGTRGITLPVDEIQARHLDDLEALVAHLAELEPGPLFLLHNEEMIHWLAQRPPLFPEREFSLFLAGWGILPSGLGDLDTDEMLERLRSAPQAILVQRRDPTSRNLRTAMPRMAAAIGRDFVVTREIGEYRVMRTRFHAERDRGTESH